jgi:thiamine pyrophosphate-dependent acetolactate synthase large subunit-like protein
VRIADIVVEELLNWKIDTIFSLHGDGINEFIEALRRRQAICQKARINFIQRPSPYTPY